MTTDEPVPLDVTGTYDMQQQIDAMARILGASPLLDGGLSWDHETRVVVVRLVDGVGGTAALKDALLAEAEGFTVEFVPVRYARVELERLANHLLSHLGEWGPTATGVGGGWDCAENRVRLLVPRGELEQAWIAAVEALHDDRIVYDTYTPNPNRRRRG